MVQWADTPHSSGHGSPVLVAVSSVVSASVLVSLPVSELVVEAASSVADVDASVLPVVEEAPSLLEAAEVEDPADPVDPADDPVDPVDSAPLPSPRVELSRSVSSGVSLQATTNASPSTTKTCSPALQVNLPSIRRRSIRCIGGWNSPPSIADKDEPA